MTVTASVLYDLVQCPQRAALNAFGNAADRDKLNSFVRLLWERGTLFECETIREFFCKNREFAGAIRELS
jgi:hypothetical protein